MVKWAIPLWDKLKEIMFLSRLKSVIILGWIFSFLMKLKLRSMEFTNPSSAVHWKPSIPLFCSDKCLLLKSRSGDIGKPVKTSWLAYKWLNDKSILLSLYNSLKHPLEMNNQLLEMLMNICISPHESFQFIVGQINFQNVWGIMKNACRNSLDFAVRKWYDLKLFLISQ